MYIDKNVTYSYVEDLFIVFSSGYFIHGSYLMCIFNKTVLVDLSHSYQIYRLLFEFLENYLICCMSLYFDI